MDAVAGTPTLGFSVHRCGVDWTENLVLPSILVCVTADYPIIMKISKSCRDGRTPNVARDV